MRKSTASQHVDADADGLIVCVRYFREKFYLSLSKTSRCSADSERPHRCYRLSNNSDSIDCMSDIPYIGYNGWEMFFPFFRAFI